MFQYLSAQVALEFQEATRTEDLVLDTELRLRQWHLASQRRAMARQRGTRLAEPEPLERAPVRADRGWLDASELDERTALERDHQQRERQRRRMVRVWAARALGAAASVEELREILTCLRCGIFPHTRGKDLATTPRNATGL